MTRQEAIEIIKKDALYNPEVAEMAIRSLEAWDDIIKNLERSNDSMCSMILNDIKKHLEEVES